MKRLLLSTALGLAATTALAGQPDYAAVARGLSMERDARGVLVVTINDGNGGPITFTSQDHTEFTKAFYRTHRAGPREQGGEPERRRRLNGRHRLRHFRRRLRPQGLEPRP